MRFRSVTLVLVLAALAAAPAQARAVTEWRDAGVAVPETVDLRAVAADGSTVIAVGTDRTTGDAVVYRRAGAAWRRDLPLPPPPPFTPEPVVDPETGEPVLDPDTGEPVMTEPPPAPPPILGDLVDVAIGAGTAWAIGAAPRDEAGGMRPLLLRLEETGWAEVEVPSTMALPRALALDGDDGLIGDAAGNVFPIADGVLAATPLARGGVLPPPSTAVHALTLTGGGRALGAARPQDSWSGFLDVGGEPRQVRRGLAESMPPGAEPIAMATAGTLAVAAEGDGPCREDAPGAAPALWTLDTTLAAWRRDVPGASAPGTRWCDVALSGTTLLLVGDRATAAGRVGAVWRRVAAGALRLEDDLDGRPLHGAALGATEAWAVGERGALWRHADWPPAPPTGDDGDDGDGGDDGGGGNGSGDAGNASGDGGHDAPPAAPEQSSGQTPAAPGPERHVVALTPSGNGPAPRRPAPKRSTTPAKPAQRLLVGLKARRTGRRLVLRFRLRARARVLVAAMRGRRVVGRLRSRPLRPGRRRLVISFRGRRPPTQLKIVVRPVGRPGANKEGKGS